MLLWTLEISVQKKILRGELVYKKIKSHMCFELNEEDMASSSRVFRKPKNAEEERKLLEKSSFAQQHQVSNILGPPENLETTGKASNAEVMGNDMESLLPADLNFEILDDVLSNMLYQITVVM